MYTKGIFAGTTSQALAPLGQIILRAFRKFTSPIYERDLRLSSYLRIIVGVVDNNRLLEVLQCHESYYARNLRRPRYKIGYRYPAPKLNGPKNATTLLSGHARDTVPAKTIVDGKLRCGEARKGKRNNNKYLGFPQHYSIFKRKDIIKRNICYTPL